MYINTETLQYPYSEMDIRRSAPDTSFPLVFQPPKPFEPVRTVDQPEYDHLTQSIVELAPRNTDGEWVQVWSVVELPVIVAEQNVRFERQRLLKDTDWTQVSDAPVDKPAWASYRQQLRDIPSQIGFPFSVIWPTPPGGNDGYN